MLDSKHALILNNFYQNNIKIDLCYTIFYNVIGIKINILTTALSTYYMSAFSNLTLPLTIQILELETSSFLQCIRWKFYSSYKA